jgi:hypothetical protein
MLCFGWNAEQFLKRTNFPKPKIISLNRRLFEITWELLCHYGALGFSAGVVAEHFPRPTAGEQLLPKRDRKGKILNVRKCSALDGMQRPYAELEKLGLPDFNRKIKNKEEPNKCSRTIITLNH